MTDLDVDPERLKEAAAQLRLAIDYAQTASEYSREADPDWWMWGIQGLVFAPVYFALADGWRSLLSDTGGAIEGLSGRLDGSAGTYEDIDSTIGEEFGKVATDIEAAVGDFAGSNQRQGRFR